VILHPLRAQGIGEIDNMHAFRIALSGALLLVGLPAAFAQSGDAVAECHRLAAFPEDQDRKAESVSYGALDGAAVIAACQKAVEANPGDGRLLAQLGRGFDKEQKGQEAIAAFEEAIERGFVPAWTALGELYQYGDGVEPDAARAAECFRKGGEAGSMMSVFSLGYLYELGEGVKQDFAEAARLYLKAVEARAEPSFAFAARNVADYYYHGLGVAENPAEGERLLRLALTSKDPIALARAQNAAAWRFGLLNVNLPEAETLARAAVTSAEKTGDDLNVRLDTLALVLFRLGRYDEALAADLRSLELGPDNASAHDHLGDIYAALGKTGEARSAWKKALEATAPGGVDGYDFDAEAIRAKMNS
jgi:tetratricopeptide (TPR) repeat protein